MAATCCLLFVLISAPVGSPVAGADRPIAQTSVVSLREPVDVISPAIDEAALSPERLTAWRDVRARFLVTARHAARTQRLLDELSSRLRLRGFALRDADVARAARMHGFLDESISFITSLDFESASRSLARADAEYARLREVVGG